MKKGITFALAVLVLLLMLAFSAFGVIRIVDLVVTAHMRRTGGLRMTMYELASMYNLISSVPEDLELIHEYNKFCNYTRGSGLTCGDFPVYSMNLVLLYNNLIEKVGKKSLGAGGALVEFIHPECPDVCPGCICKVIRDFPINLYDYYGGRIIGEKDAWIMPTKYGLKFRKSSFVWQSDFADVIDEIPSKLITQEVGLESMVIKLRDFCVENACDIPYESEFILFPYSKINNTVTEICEYSCFNANSFLDESEYEDVCTSWHKAVCFDISEFKNVQSGICKNSVFKIGVGDEVISNSCEENECLCGNEGKECIGKTLFPIEEQEDLEYVWSEGVNEYYFNSLNIDDSGNKFKLIIRCHTTTPKRIIIDVQE